MGTLVWDGSRRGLMMQRRTVLHEFVQPLITRDRNIIILYTIYKVLYYIYSTYIQCTCQIFLSSKCGALTLQQIARYADDPWWRNLRRGLMISVWMSMALMILAAVLIAIVEHEQVCVAGKSMVTPFGSPSMAPPWHVSDRRDDDAPTSSSSSAAAVAAATLSFVPADVIQASGGSTAAAIATATATAAAGNGL